MKRKTRFVLSALGVAACVSAVLIAFHVWRSRNTDLSAADRTAVRRDRERLTRDWWVPLKIAGHDGADWFVPMARGKDSRMCWRVQGDTRVDVGEFAPKEWQFVNHQAAVLLSDGSLLVAWSGFDGTQGEKVAIAVNDGKAWSSPTILATGVQVRCLDAAVDANGRPHVLYVSPLEPYESYGPIDGFFPYKCWHSFHDGQTWTSANPIQGRGRFDIDEAILTLTPSKRLVVSVEVREQFSPAGRYLAVQVLDEAGWSKLMRL